MNAAESKPVLTWEMKGHRLWGVQIGILLEIGYFVDDQAEHSSQFVDTEAVSTSRAESNEVMGSLEVESTLDGENRGGSVVRQFDSGTGGDVVPWCLLWNQVVRGFSFELDVNFDEKNAGKVWVFVYKHLFNWWLLFGDGLLVMPYWWGVLLSIWCYPILNESEPSLFYGSLVLYFAKNHFQCPR